MLFCIVVLISKTLGRFLICFAVVTSEYLSGKSFSSGLLLLSSVLFSDSVSKAGKVSEWVRFAMVWMGSNTDSNCKKWLTRDDACSGCFWEC